MNTTIEERNLKGNNSIFNTKSSTRRARHQYRKTELRKSTEEFLKDCVNSSNLEFNQFVTLTFRQNTSRKEITGTIKYLKNRLNRECFGNNFRRKELSVGIIPVIEGKELLHCHLLISVPDDSNCNIRKTIASLRKVDQQIDIRPIDGVSGLLEYCTKEVKIDTDCVDWENLSV